MCIKMAGEHNKTALPVKKNYIIKITWALSRSSRTALCSLVTSQTTANWISLCPRKKLWALIFSQTAIADFPFGTLQFSMSQNTPRACKKMLVTVTHFRSIQSKWYFPREGKDGFQEFYRVFATGSFVTFGLVSSMPRVR